MIRRKTTKKDLLAQIRNQCFRISFRNSYHWNVAFGVNISHSGVPNWYSNNLTLWSFARREFLLRRVWSGVKDVNTTKGWNLYLKLDLYRNVDIRCSKGEAHGTMFHIAHTILYVWRRFPRSVDEVQHTVQRPYPVYSRIPSQIISIGFRWNLVLES